MYSLQKVLRPIDYEQSLVFGEKKKKKARKKKLKLARRAEHWELGARKVGLTWRVPRNFYGSSLRRRGCS